VQGNNAANNESEDIMKTTLDMAREAGIIDPRDAFSEEHVQAVLQDLKAFEALVRADEREACAKECKIDRTSADIEIAIRARGNT
jgi:hypothetical protein